MLLLTGSNGQVGKELIKNLKKEKIKFYAKPKKDLNINHKKKLSAFIHKNGIRFIVNLAAFTKVDEAEINQKLCLKTNYEGVKNLTDICVKNDIFLIHISSDYVFYGSKKKPYREIDITNPINFYGKSKLMSEKYIIKNCKKYIIIRTSWIFSQYKNNFISFIKEKVNKNKKINLIFNQIGTPTSARSLSIIIVKFIKKIKSKNKSIYGIYNFVNSPETSWFNFGSYYIKVVLKKNQYPVNSIKVEELNLKAKRPKYSALDNKKINKTLKINNFLWKKELRFI